MDPNDYADLTPAQRTRFEALMDMKMTEWPEALHQYMRDQGGPYDGEGLARKVGGWVKTQIPA